MKVMSLLRGFRRLLILLGLVFIGVLVLPATRVPWQWVGAMARPGVNAPESPAVIIMMGGGGIPSESGLMRSWKTAEAALRYPGAKVVVAMPREPGESEIGVVERELIMRGVVAARLGREPKGRNTREQAMEMVAMLRPQSGDDTLPVVALVTSPEHMKRTWRSFQRVGFSRLIALPSWPEAIAADLRYDEKELGAPSLGGAIGGSNMIKYRYWDNAGILIKCAREAVALAYYRVMGWI